jgi:uncharacterized protein YecE (DUF72 family)
VAGTLLIGTSGFSYKDWKGPFYPEKLSDRNMLSYYALHFRAVEVNSTYYHIPPPRNIDAMVKKSEGKVEFVVKAHQDITHNREKADEAIPKLIEAIEPMRASRTLGCVLLQFPFSFKHTKEGESFLLSVKERFGAIPLVAEFRHAGWIEEPVFELLKKNRIGFCCVDEPRLPNLPPPVATATSDIGYVRFHGRNRAKWWRHGEASERYDYLYSEEELKEWLPKIRALLSVAEKVYAFFNNHPGGKAVANAKMLERMMQ